MLSAKLRNLIADPDLALDLGTASTRIFAAGLGLVVDEPTKVRLSEAPPDGPGDGPTRRPGQEADGCWATPVKAGVVTDLPATVEMLRPLLSRTRRFGLFRPRVLACAPAAATDEERQALREALRLAGAAAVSIIPETRAAAIGAGFDLSLPYAQMLADIGDGVTEVAVLRSGEVVRQASIRVACSDLKDAIRATVLAHHGVTLFGTEAERLMKAVGIRNGTDKTGTLMAIGAAPDSGATRRIRVERQDVAQAMSPVIGEIVSVIRSVLLALPAGIACEVIESGLCLTGGGACLGGMSAKLAQETSLDVRTAANPVYAVINGAGEILSLATRNAHWSS